MKLPYFTTLSDLTVQLDLHSLLLSLALLALISDPSIPAPVWVTESSPILGLFMLPIEVSLADSTKSKNDHRSFSPYPSHIIPPEKSTEPSESCLMPPGFRSSGCTSHKPHIQEVFPRSDPTAIWHRHLSQRLEELPDLHHCLPPILMK